ncbi:putative tail protein [Synechococcus phage S-CBWM1]|uniref:Putative tail protein n=1 Tax=Synechococcus phage S-CBWM1 TaxID=2053653 RepID=A0A3G1L3M6_9CAUD|nr:putative tail protein [Synechococcus phage S-CBWM1]ATW62777.1 putative tail protein [Synechococcus phage S-CBWM1]
MRPALWLVLTPPPSRRGSGLPPDAFAFTINMASAGTYTLLTADAVNYAVNWGDGSSETGITSNNKTHAYAAAGDYQIQVTSTVACRFYMNNNATERLRTKTVDYSTFSGTAAGNSLASAWYGCSSLTSFPALPDTSLVTTFFAAWADCSSLTSFPALPDTSQVTNFSAAWYNCSSLTSFPALPDTSLVTNFGSTWSGCSSLTSFPALPNTSQVTSFQAAWRDCSSLTSFPALPDTSKATDFGSAWYGCSSLTSFPANQFDTTGTLAANAFTGAFQNCALTAASIENILTSLVTNGQSGKTLSLQGGTNAGASTWTPAAVTAYDTLISRDWSITRKA